MPAGSWRAAARNAGWRAAAEGLVAFLHDDCRPLADWLERLVEVADSSPGAVIEGALDLDPEQTAFLLARLKRLRRSRPPAPEPAACNLACPRDVTERL